MVVARALRRPSSKKTSDGPAKEAEHLVWQKIPNQPGEAPSTLAKDSEAEQNVGDQEKWMVFSGESGGRAQTKISKGKGQ